MRGRCARAALVAMAAAAALAGCDDKPRAGPASTGSGSGPAATLPGEEISTGLGLARAIDASSLPTSTKWQRVVVLDDRRAALFGETTDAAVALTTDDAGKSWRAVVGEKRGGSAAWSVGSDGTLVLATGAPEKRPPGLAGQGVLLAGMELRFAAPGAQALGAPVAAARTIPAGTAVRVASSAAVPAVLAPELAALVAEDALRRPMLAYAPSRGADPIEPLRLPPGERAIPMPYGRPPMLLTARGRDVAVRVVHSPGKDVDAAKSTGIVATPPVLAELAAPPACDADEWSFQVVSHPFGRPSVVGVSIGRVVTVALPATAVKPPRLGCAAGRFVAPIVEPKQKVSLLATCDLQGACTVSEKPPFKLWPGTPAHEVAAVPTALGAVAVLTQSAGDKWGVYVTQSTDRGKLFDPPRAIAEGTGDIGRIGFGALVSFGRRVALLLSGDVRGTERRAWYVLVSDDGGVTWSPP